MYKELMKNLKKSRLKERKEETYNIRKEVKKGETEKAQVINKETKRIVLIIQQDATSK